ncbi:hypothetical protein [Halobellus rufus]|uniref:hypothetical protein n=1 Tax=Halobellus rufus TaxID=1448860 RepID=UPI00067948C6|nr:hypothetical protein [Halobellus rufus]
MSEDDASRSEVFGPIDAGALREIRDLFTTAEPLVERAALDDSLNPQTLSVGFSDGIGDASTARFDVRWSLTGYYAFHYSDDLGRNFRFDHHPKPDAPSRHFHSPPDAPSRPVEPSCIAVGELPLVTRAVLQRWRDAYDRGALDRLNEAVDPP